MRKDLRLSLIQTFLHWEDPLANREVLARKMEPLAGQTDLVVLPEMFTTGFSMRPAVLAEPTEGPTLEWMAGQAALLNAVVTGSFIARDGHRYFNRLVWMRPDGSYSVYDKRHLFSLGGEHEHYTAGQERVLVECQGWKVLPLICYDLRFPVWSRNTENYDLLLYVANWPERRSDAWQALLTARAIENQAYTAGVNRIGSDGHEVYHSGNSSLIDYSGRTLFHCAHQEAVFTATLSRQEQTDFRARLQFLADRDDFSLSL